MSALSQNVPDIEAIMVDDGSKDESLAIAGKIEDPRLRIVANETNLGTYGTQNRGLELARGTWVAILNSDDVWLPGKLAAQLELASRHPELDLIACRGNLVDVAGATLPDDQHAHWPTAEVQDALPHLLVENRILASGVMFKRGRFSFDEALRYSGDWQLLLNAADRGVIGWVDTPLVGWRQHGSNSYTRSEAVTLEEIRMRARILRRFSGRHRPSLALCAMNMSALMVLCQEVSLARSYISTAMALDPSNNSIRKRYVLSKLPVGLQQRRLWPDAVPMRGLGAKIEQILREEHSTLD
ncbi:MAG: hypothetical protein HONBIEJF_00836 [Fimbriimonadaceae bacterium]|nr:hypothetical protein [Fimbriimonadaceae bacterium]